MTQRRRLNTMVNSICPANRDVAVVMDDETYLTLDGNDWQGTSYFTSLTKEVSYEVPQEGAAVADNQREGDIKAALLSLRTGRERGHL